MIAIGETYEKLESVGRGKAKVERVCNRVYVHTAQIDAFDAGAETVTLEYRPSGRMRHLPRTDAEQLLSDWRKAQ